MTYRVYQKHLLLNGDLHREPENQPVFKNFWCSRALLYRRVIQWDVKNSPFYYIIQDKILREEDLRSKDRSALRKSLRNLQYEVVSLDVLVREGLRLYKLMPAIGDVEPNSESFKNYLSGRSENQDYWLVRNEEGLCVGFAVCTIFKESVDLSILRVSREDKSNAVYGLVFKMNDFYLRQQGKKYINDGFKSYLHGAGFQNLLVRKLGFRNCYVRIKIHSKVPLKIISGALKMLGKNEKAQAFYQYLTDYNEQR